MRPAPWLDIAMLEAGVALFPTGSSNPRIEAYHRTIPQVRWDDKVPWCSSFLNWCMHAAGLPGTDSALARSWLDWGIPLAAPERGCVVVLWRDEPASAKGHVGLLLREDDTRVLLWGGNQLGTVREHSYPKASVLGCRWPASTRFPASASHPGTTS
jgi:uncharacterized protein (TIGR02594 family)